MHYCSLLGLYAQSLGYRVRLLHPRYVRPYRHRNKIGRNHCDAMLETARCIYVHPIPVKIYAQQQLQQLHGVRETWRKIRIRRINLERGILCEAKIEAPTSTAAFIHAAHELVERGELSPLSQ